MEAVDHALLKVREAMPDLTQQAQELRVRPSITPSVKQRLHFANSGHKPICQSVTPPLEGSKEWHNNERITKRTGATVMQAIKQTRPAR
jgi:hypothetical protein